MPPKKPRALRSRTCSENMSDGGKPPPKKPRGKRGNVEEGTTWVDDNSFKKGDDDDDDDDDDSSYVCSEDGEIDEEFIGNLLRKAYAEQAEPTMAPRRSERKATIVAAPIKLTKIEEEYYRNQAPGRRKDLHDLMARISGLVLDEGQVPHKFRVLELPISDYVKSTVIKKIGILNDTDNNEGHKLRSWVDAFMRIPFGKSVPLPVQLYDGQEKCTEFMLNSTRIMNKHIYGMEPAKLQILQMMAQWIVNPRSVGNVIALQGPMGVGKTSFARNAIAQVLQRPFEFFTLGGASDIANFVGHSYTYEGSMWGRIVDSIMHAGVMNPVMYFDELDKVSSTPQGEEIISMMIHLTDKSQNTQFHDRYFAGVDFDLSQCLFVFSFNDIEKVHPILRDRMTVIHCSGYSEADKKVILKDYIVPEVLGRLMFTSEEVTLTDSAMKYLISEYSSDEKGVRTLIRMIDSMMTRINMLRVTRHESMKAYKFYMDIQFPLVITETIVQKMLEDINKKEVESWKSMYN